MRIYKRNTFCFAVTIMMLLTSATVFGKTINSRDFENSEFIKIDYEMETPIISEVKINDVDYSQIQISDDYQFISNVNQPKIPFKTCNLLLPPDSEILTIDVEFKDKEVLDLKNPIEPGQQALPFSLAIENPNLMSFSEPDENIYSSNDLFPSKDFDISSVQDKNGFKILFLNVYPYKFCPAANRLEFAKKVEVSVKIEINNNHKSSNSLYRGLAEDAESVAKIVDNPLQIKSYESLSSPNLLGSEQIDYLIITSEELKNYEGEYNFQALRDARIQSGLNAKIVTVEEISQSTASTYKAQEIRDFLKSVYAEWGIKYVLLGGDWDIVPSMSIRFEVPTFGIPPLITGNILFDLYYACLGEKAPDGTANCDLTAEVYVGRASVETPQELENFVYKTLKYENSESEYLKNCLWLGETLFPSIVGGPGEYAAWKLDESVNYCKVSGPMEKKLNGLPVGGDGYNLDRMYERNGYWEEQDVIEAINKELYSDSGYHLINHLGHGNVDKVMKINNQEVLSYLHNNDHFFIYSQACLPGSFIHNDCIAEALTVKTNKGAFAAIMNSHYGWGTTNTVDGCSQDYADAFWEIIYGENVNTFGMANHKSKETLIGRLAGDDPMNIIMRWCYYETNLFGDPALKIHGAKANIETNSEDDNDDLESDLDISLGVSSDEIDFGTVSLNTNEKVIKTFEIWNKFEGTQLQYSISEDCSWAEVSPLNGVSNGEINKIEITVDPSKLSGCGDYSSKLKIISNGGERTININLESVFLVNSISTASTDDEQTQSTYSITSNLDYSQGSDTKYTEQWNKVEGTVGGTYYSNPEGKNEGPKFGNQIPQLFLMFEDIPSSLIAVGQSHFVPWIGDGVAAKPDNPSGPNYPSDYKHYYQIHRGFVSFDTSTLPEDIELGKAKLNLHGYKAQRCSRDFDIVVQHANGDYPHTPLLAEDFDKSLYSSELGSINTQDMNGYNQILLNYDNNNQLNSMKNNDVTSFVLRSQKDINGIAPDCSFAQNVMLISSAEGDNPPQLLVKYGSKPDIPYDIHPVSGTSVSDTSLQLSVRVSDPDENSMTVKFFDATDNSLIGFVQNVDNGDTAHVMFNELCIGKNYNWYVIVSDGVFQTQSDVFTFTVEDNPTHSPVTPKNPIPSNNAKNVDINTKLSFTSGDIDQGDEVTYEVFFGTDENPGKIDTIGPFSAQKTKIDIDPGTLEKDKQYYWKIIATDKEGKTSQSSTWFFKTSKDDVARPGKVSIMLDNINKNSLKIFLINENEKDYSNVNWEISIKSKFTNSVDQSNTGVINSFTHNREVTIHSDEIKSKLGFFKIQISINANDKIFEKTVSALKIANYIIILS